VIEELINREIVVKYRLTKGAFFYVLNILAKQKVGHFLITVLQRTPALDQDISIRQPTAQGYS
jgi:hypothetical protein